MNNEFLLIHKSIAPDYYELVIQARKLIEGDNRPVSDVCKEIGISRSTYYKYKDLVSYPPTSFQHKVIISFKVDDEAGVLSSILSVIYNDNGNVLTINQEMPMRNLAYITVMVNLEKVNKSIDEFLNDLRKLEHIRSVEVLSYE